MARVEVGDGEHLLLASEFGGEAPGGRGADEKHFPQVRKIDRDSEGSPGNVAHASEPKIEKLDRLVWPAPGNGAAAKAIHKGRNILLERGLMSGVKVEPIDEWLQLIVPPSMDYLLEGNKIGT